jgi:hypothetical protein
MADEKNPPAISAISIKGFKSLLEEQRLEIRPLTLLAGTNGSGKSSAIQPVLLLKQTLEAPFDPGPLRLDGPNVRFSSAEQFFSRIALHAYKTQFSVCIEDSQGRSVRNIFVKSGRFGVELASTQVRTTHPKQIVNLKPGMTSEGGSQVVRDRCFLDYQILGVSMFTNIFRNLIISMIHVPGLRGNPARAYRTAAVGDHFPGTFENYVASVILFWQVAQDPRLGLLESWFRALELTDQVHANPIDATQIEILVGRRPVGHTGVRDLVNIADVGVGVSQVLPVLVALITAQSGQLVYLEEPELHLHPRAQQALATVLSDAANRGVRVVAETHSSILLLAVQALVAEGKISPDQVLLHWFQRDTRGATKVTCGEIDELGAYGDWPEDFGEVEAAVDNRYLDAVESKVFSRKKRAKK